MRLAKADPELVSLLSGTAPAGLVADALTGALSPVARTPEQRQKAATAEEVKQLVESNPYRAGNLTQALRLEQLDPQAAARLRKESNVQNPSEKAAAEQAAKEQHEKALAQNVEAGRLQQLAKAQAAAAQLPNVPLRY